MESKSQNVWKQDEKLLNWKKIKGQGTIEACRGLRPVQCSQSFLQKTVRRSNEPLPHSAYNMMIGKSQTSK